MDKERQQWGDDLQRAIKNFNRLPTPGLGLSGQFAQAQLFPLGQAQQSPPVPGGVTIPADLAEKIKLLGLLAAIEFVRDNSPNVRLKIPVKVVDKLVRSGYLSKSDLREGRVLGVPISVY